MSAWFMMLNGYGKRTSFPSGSGTPVRFFAVQRDAMAMDDLKSPALYFGTTCGQLWMGRDSGED
jgi:hypothetical protein